MVLDELHRLFCLGPCPCPLGLRMMIPMHVLVFAATTAVVRVHVPPLHLRPTCRSCAQSRLNSARIMLYPVMPTC